MSVNTGVSIERARQLVNANVRTDDARREEIAQRVFEKGEAVWHAAAQVFGTRCRCGACEPRLNSLRPGDAAAIYAEETGVSYARALVATNTD